MAKQRTQHTRTHSRVALYLQQLEEEELELVRLTTEVGLAKAELEMRIRRAEPLRRLKAQQELLGQEGD